jgi:hypothetical protein
MAMKKSTRECPSDDVMGREHLPFHYSGPGLGFRAPRPKSYAGASEAGRAAALSYLKHLRSGDGFHCETYLTAIVEAIHYGNGDRKPSERDMLAFGFLSTLDTWLRRAAQQLEAAQQLDGVCGEELRAKISGGLEMTQAQATRDFRSAVAKSGWDTRRRRQRGALRAQEGPRHG